ncbi:glutathione synthetase [Moniliophthora roreri MCA 2997]|uniref:Glutathione synthetase n=2 Tax=Moniliophthora roreri TaxID=221103 RepID=V2XPQ6_MONRO|nr:glutathione synthetase [Moniliophthora roreri MCA 2997]KAI3619631.1 glutathione synthetase [Moniliophthora roreri]
MNTDSYPPSLTLEQLNHLHKLATTYALSHGLCYLPPSPTSPPTSSIHAPLSLFPSPFPRKLFEKVRRVQATYNVLYSKIAMDEEFLDDVLGCSTGEEGEKKGARVGDVDTFVGKLWRGWKVLREKGEITQPLHLGLFRSDYLLHSTDGELDIKQVEFNTISSSFGPLSERAAAMHRYLCHASPAHPWLKQENLPRNETTKGLVEGLAKTHEAYGANNARILFVVQPNERNLFDQMWLEYELLQRYNIPVIRQTLTQLTSSASIHPESSALLINGDIEISVIYFRATYTPADFPDEKHYAARFLLEKSRAIKCPSIPLQLAGSKKVQQVLAEPGILEHFLSPTEFDLEELRTSWVGMFALDSVEGMQKAETGYSKLVLKPQREGGGNNVYHSSIPGFLETLPVKERKAWIGMELIRVPQGVQNFLVRADTLEVVRAEVISELGIFGYSLFGVGQGANGVREEKEIGWLVRTKGKESDEGGVATGFSVLGGLVLVD